MFEIGSYVVCPGHGVGQIHNVEDKELGGEKKSYYDIKILANGMKVMIPVDSQEGIRTLVSDNEISEVFSLLADHDVDVDCSTWNRRYREYMLKIKTGSLLEIAQVLRELFLLKTNKNLSFGERKLLDQCRDLIAQEVAISKGGEKVEVARRIDACFGTSQLV